MDKQELIDKLNRNDLTEQQICEIVNVLDGQITDRHLFNKAESVISEFLKSIRDIASPNVWLLLYRFLTLFVIVTLIYLLAIREPENSSQVWTIVGAFIGFIFGQKSSFLRF
jgi:hypothetical protein